jgi:hypothetical protein
MWLVLCELGDASALWAYAGLQARGLRPIAVASSDELGCALRFEHRLGRDGISTAVTLGRGLSISSGTLSGVVNRLVGPSSAATVGAGQHDREYARQELLAVTLSWLAALPCPVLGRPTPQGLCGSWRPRSEWLWLAASAGFATPRYAVSTADPPADEWVEPLPQQGKSVLVIGDRVVGEAPPGVHARAIALAALAGADILGVSLTSDWSFVSATPLPDLVAGGDGALGAIAAALAAA